MHNIRSPVMRFVCLQPQLRCIPWPSAHLIGRKAPAPFKGPVHRRLLPAVLPRKMYSPFLESTAAAPTVGQRLAANVHTASSSLIQCIVSPSTCAKHPLALRKKLLSTAKTTSPRAQYPRTQFFSHRSSPPKLLLSKSPGAHSAPAGATSSSTPKPAPAEAAAGYRGRDSPTGSGCDSLTLQAEKGTAKISIKGAALRYSGRLSLCHAWLPPHSPLCSFQNGGRSDK